MTALIHAADPGERERSAQVERAESDLRSGHMFDPWLVCRHPAVIALGDNLLQGYDRLTPPRKRAMKQRDRENLEATLRTILANLAYAVATNAVPLSVGVKLRAEKLTRYDRRGLACLPIALEVLASAGVITLRKSTERGTASAIAPGPDLMAALGRLPFEPDDFGEAPGREVLCLGRTERDYVERTTTRKLIDYRETEETRRLRAEVETLNRFLASADIRMVPDGGPVVVTTRRMLHRSFTVPPGAEDAERFDRGGRLFGGFWQVLPKARRHALRIDGEPVADLDYSSMFLRLAYLEAGEMPPEGDLYATVPGLYETRWRQGVKKLVSAMLFRTTPLTRIPADLKGHLPEGMTGAQARTAIFSAYPALHGVFETGVGFRLMHTESRVLLAALRRLIALGTPALPMHDGLMVAQSKAEDTRAAMCSAAEEVVGFTLPISLKSL